MFGYYFNLPQITVLTIPQQAALNETQQIALSGGPGTGKSVVLLWRHIANYENGKKSLLLTYTTTLTKYLTASCVGYGECANYVGTALRGRKRLCGQDRWDEVIIDEAQDLEKKYFFSLENINLSYGADDCQKLYLKETVNEKYLRSLYSLNIDRILNKNFRNTQSIIKFAKVAFPNALIERDIIDGLSDNVGELPALLITGGNNLENINKKQNDSIIQIIKTYQSETHNISILVPWKSDVKQFVKILEENKIENFSFYYNDITDFPKGCVDISNVHITTFKSSKGLEFDTVIIPNFHKYNKDLRKYNVEWNDYYVAVTRTRSNLYLITDYYLQLLDSVTDQKEI